MSAETSVILGFNCPYFSILFALQLDEEYGGHPFTPETRSPFLFNGAWFLGTYLLLQLGEQAGLAGFYNSYAVLAASLLLGFLLNLTLCIVNFVRGRQAVGYTYLFIIVAFLLLVKQFSAINVPGKIGG